MTAATCPQGHVLTEGGVCAACSHMNAEQQRRAGAEPLGPLLDDVQGFVTRYVVMSDPQAVTLTLWTIHCHAFGRAEVTAYMAVTSAERQSGKTLLLEIMQLLVPKPWLTGRVTPAVLYRKIDAECPTLLLDESDAAFNGDKDYAQALRGILNSGQRSGGFASACVGQGVNISYRDFSTFSPKMIAGIGNLPSTIADRAIAIVLRRAAPNERPGRFRYRKAKVLATPIKDRLEAWAAACADLLDDEPSVPAALNHRAQDGWEPLLAIADLAGGDWPQKAREAAVVLSARGVQADESLGVVLLTDIRGIFAETDADRITSNKLLHALIGLEESPWGDLRGKPLSARRLSRILKPFEVTSRTIRWPGDIVAKGYLKEDFYDAWLRYLPPPPPPESALQALQGLQASDTDTGDCNDVTDVTANTGSGTGGEKEALA